MSQNRTPTPLDLALEVTWHLKEGKERIQKELDSREIGLVLGWAALAVEDKTKKSELTRALGEELEEIYQPRSTKEPRLIKEILKEFDCRLDIKFLRGSRYGEEANRVFWAIACDTELDRSLETHIPLGERASIIRGWIEMQRQQIAFFRENMFRWQTKEGQVPAIEAPAPRASTGEQK